MEELEKVKSLNSCDWAIEMNVLINSQLVVLGWNADTEVPLPEHRWIVLSFDSPSSCASVDYSRMWQHASVDRDTPVLFVRDHKSDKTHIQELTLNLESYPDGWFSCRVEGQCDAIDIICRDLPTIGFHKSEPDLLKWWAHGYTFNHGNA